MPFHLRSAIPATIIAVLLHLLLLVTPSRGEDSDTFRPYFRFGNGDIGANWGVTDQWSFSLGANFDLYWSGELGIDYYERKFNYQQRNLGEISGWHVVPQVRLRTPLLKKRLSPYLIAGAGVSFLQFKDEEAGEAARGTQVDISGSTFTITAGGGIDYFISDNVALNLEGRYFYLQPVSGTVDGHKVDADISAPTFTAALRVYTRENHHRPLADAGGAAPGRAYIGFRVGGAVLTDDRLTTSVTLGSDHPSIGALNQTGGLLFGWNFNSKWGTELAWDFLEFRAKLDGKEIGEYSMKMVIPQLRYRMPLEDGRWVPYLSGGVGVSFSEFNDRTAGGEGLKISSSGFHPSSTIGAGVEYFVHRNLSLLADIGWIYSWHQEFGVAGFPGSHGDSSVFVSRLGIRAYFLD